MTVVTFMAFTQTIMVCPTCRRIRGCICAPRPTGLQPYVERVQRDMTTVTIEQPKVRLK